MANTTATANDALPGESPAQTKARLRRERLAAKNGAVRLQQISALQGGQPKDTSQFVKDVPVQSPPMVQQQTVAGSGTATTTAAAAATTGRREADDPGYRRTNAAQSALPSSTSLSSSSLEQPSDPSQDAIMAMLQQIMGGDANSMPGRPSGGHTGPGSDSLPPLAKFFSVMHGGAAPEQAAEQQSLGWMWRLVHSVFSFGLAIYFVLRTPYTGSRLSRRGLVDGDLDSTIPLSPSPEFAHFFYVFATFELILQSSRYLVERGQLQGSGFLSTVAGILPAPYAGYVRTIGRYSIICRTIIGDAMVVVFVLGATSWWRGATVT